jgi:hypothetical protein
MRIGSFGSSISTSRTADAPQAGSGKLTAESAEELAKQLHLALYDLPENIDRSEPLWPLEGDLTHHWTSDEPEAVETPEGWKISVLRYQNDGSPTEQEILQAFDLFFQQNGMPLSSSDLVLELKEKPRDTRS